MIKCPNCTSDEWVPGVRNPVDPEKDTFRCKDCGEKFTRREARNAGNKHI